MKRLNTMLSITAPLDGLLVDQRFLPTFCQTALYNQTVPTDISGGGGGEKF